MNLLQNEIVVQIPSVLNGAATGFLGIGALVVLGLATLSMIAFLALVQKGIIHI